MLWVDEVKQSRYADPGIGRMGRQERSVRANEALVADLCPSGGPPPVDRPRRRQPAPLIAPVNTEINGEVVG
jgi:hypothetical protein